MTKDDISVYTPRTSNASPFRTPKFLRKLFKSSARHFRSPSPNKQVTTCRSSQTICVVAGDQTRIEADELNDDEKPQFCILDPKRDSLHSDTSKFDIDSSKTIHPLSNTDTTKRTITSKLCVIL